jgi:hypothetical protein
MTFRWFIYYCALIGGCAAYVGWAMGRIPPVQQHVFQAAMRGMFLGLALAIGLTLVDVFWHLSGRDGAVVVLRFLVAGMVGGMGGFIGGMVGQILYSTTLLALFLVIGWTITGVLIGMAPGIFDLLVRLSRNEESSGARRKVINGLLGGMVGGLIGGLLFLGVRGLWGLAFGDKADEFWSPSAMGFVALGLCIGLFIGLAQVILKTAWIVVVTGFRAGRELLLSRGEMIIGRAEGCDIPLYGDPGIEKEHARIVLRNGRYSIEDLHTPGGTFVNGARVGRPMTLRAGDLIELGRSALRFGERVKREEG